MVLHVGFINTSMETCQSKIYRRKHRSQRRKQQVPNFRRTEEVKSSAFSVLASPKSPIEISGNYRQIKDEELINHLCPM